MSYLKEKRLELGLTQFQLSEIVGVDAKTIAHWENLKTVPKRINHFEILGELFHISPFDLLDIVMRDYNENKNS